MPFIVRPTCRVPVCCPVTDQTGVLESCARVWNSSLTGWRFSGNLPLKERWLRGIDVRDRLLLARMVDENRGRGGYNVETLVMDDDSEADLGEYLRPRESESDENSD